MLIDSHAHLDDSRFTPDREETLERAWNAGVRSIITIGNGAGPDDMACGVPIAEAHDWVWTSVGIHPHDAARAEERHYAVMRDFARHPKIIAIGEAGLDYHYDYSPRETQRAVFRRQLEIAGELNLPIIVHTREADADTETILRETGVTRGALHCFTSSARLAEFALGIGFLISFSGIVTFRNSTALVDIARTIPDDRILVETDAPYLAPLPYRGKRNEPAMVVETARRLAEARGAGIETFAAQTSANCRRLFSLVKTA
ncbi:MAG TPA: TatD family hydrolase [Terriglobia bacterium]|nr:TatD family hydrolase [Terriglobia bacterium]